MLLLALNLLIICDAQDCHKGETCRSLQLEKQQLEDRLSSLKTDSLVQRTDSASSAAISPRGTAFLRTLRDENEHLKQQLQVPPLSPSGSALSATPSASR